MRRLENVLTDYVIREGAVKEEDKTLYQYAFQRIWEMALNLAISFFIAVFLHMAPEGILFFLVFIPLRSYAGGLHLKHGVTCLALSSVTYTVILLVVKFSRLPVWIAVAVFLGSMTAIWLLYPVEHRNRSVDQEEDTYFKKRLKLYLCADFTIAALCLAFQKYNCLSLLAATLFLAAITMAIGKGKDRVKRKKPDRVYTG